MSDKKFQEKLVHMNNKYIKARQTWGNDLLSNVKKTLRKNSYRTDLKMICKEASSGDFEAKVKYDIYLEYPTKQDLSAIVAQHFPTHEINWELVDVDDHDGTVTMMLSPAQEIIPLQSVRDIPKEFEAVGTGTYKRAQVADKSIYEIWSLVQNGNDYALIRNKDEYEVVSSEKFKFRKGDIVATPYGEGIFQEYDNIGNGFVQVGNRKHLVAKDELMEHYLGTDKDEKYNSKKDKTKEYDYFSQVYGPEYAKQLVDSESAIERKKK